MKGVGQMKKICIANEEIQYLLKIKNKKIMVKIEK